MDFLSVNKGFLDYTCLRDNVVLHPALRERIDKSTVAREQITTFKVLNIEFFPRESHIVTFRDPWEFPVLFHPGCNNLVRQQMEDVAQKVSPGVSLLELGRRLT